MRRPCAGPEVGHPEVHGGVRGGHVVHRGELLLGVGPQDGAADARVFVDAGGAGVAGAGAEGDLSQCCAERADHRNPFQVPWRERPVQIGELVAGALDEQQGGAVHRVGARG